MNENGIHQKLMDESYELWEKKINKMLNYSKFLDLILNKLDEIHFLAVIFGNLNAEVENGGFSQWHDNEYDITIDQITEFLEKNEKTEICHKVLMIIQEVQEILDWIEDGKRKVRNIDFEYREFFENALEDKGQEDLHRYDSRYYKISEEFLEFLESYFTKEINEKFGGENISSPTASVQ